jgi:hypothetical protein
MLGSACGAIAAVLRRSRLWIARQADAADWGVGRVAADAEVLYGELVGRPLGAEPAARGSDVQRQLSWRLCTEDKAIPRTYWLDLFTGNTWLEFLAAGGTVSGFRQTRCKTVFRMKQGDYLICYLTGISRWIGILEVTGPAFKSDDPIWKDEAFPCRVPVRVVHALKPETAVPVLSLRDSLSVFQGLKNPNLWSGAFRGSPAQWSTPDGEKIVDAVKDAQANPVLRPVDPKKLGRRPVAAATEIGPVVIPDSKEAEDDEEIVSDAEAADAAEAGLIISPEPSASEHTEIQALLLRLGAAMKLDVWVAYNDRSRTYQGTSLGAMPRMREKLPTSFAPHAQKIVSLIDVLWLDGPAIVAAFEIESTTSIYSGLLRMADLLALQPNVSIPLYIVAPDDRRDRVLQEVNRPTFSKLGLAAACGYIPFSSIREEVGKGGKYLGYLRPEFLVELAESCVIEEA